MDDRHLLEMSAKAAGLVINAKKQADRDSMGFGHVGLWILGGHTCWNPLVDSGCAFQLMVAAGLSVDVLDGVVIAHGYSEHGDVHGCDAVAAARRVVVSAAAELGAMMP